MIARVSAVAFVALGVSCAALLDIKELLPPDAEGGTAEAGVEGGTDGGTCAEAGVVNLTRAPRVVRTALDDKDVYVTRGDPPRDSAILRCSKCGCESPTEVVSKINLPAGLAVDDRFVYWTDSIVAGSLNRIDKNDPSAIQTLSPLESPIGLVVDEEHVYWSVIGGGPNGVTTAGVFRAKKANFSEVTKLARSETLPDNLVPYALAVDETHLYYSTAPDINDNNPQTPCNGSFGTIRRVDKRGGLQTSEVIAAGQACPLGLALSDDRVYWANIGEGSGIAGSVWTKPKVGGSLTRLADGEGRPTSIAFHDGRLTWNTPANQRLSTCLAPSCTEITSLASDQRNPSGITADATGIYWAVLGTVGENFADGAIRRASVPR